MNLALNHIASWLSFPVYALQGTYVRNTTPRMDPAVCPRLGTLGSMRASHPGRGEEIRLLVIGDSSAGGFGVDSMDESLGAHLASILNQRTGRPVSVFAMGFNSAVAAELRDEVVGNLEHRDWTHVLVSVGINDTKNFHSLRRWTKGFGRLIFALRARFPGARIIWPEILAVKDMPRLPSPLRDIMEWRAQLLNARGRCLCSERGAYWLPRMLKGGPQCYALDGFHANSYGYRVWAEHMVEEMLKQPELI
ncbi:MAG: SGNH/GDSL hydrolase family protein [Pseudomonadota bacterium]